MNKELKRFIKFGLVGLTNTIVDLLIFNLVMKLGFNIYVATTVAFIFAATNSYFLNRSWTFSDNKTDKVGRQYLAFAGVAFIGLLLNLLIVHLFTNYVHIENPLLKANVTRIAAIAIVLFWNYGVSRFVLFKPQAKD